MRKAIRVGVDLLSYSQEEKVMGKKVSDFLKSEILSSVFYLAFGLCLLLVPDQTVNIICKIVFGLVMIASGIYHIVIYTAEKEKATILDLFTGVIVMVLGIFLFFTPQIVIKILPYLLGALVLVDSIWKIKGSYRLKKAQRGRWKIILIGCLVFIALGVSMLLYSFLSVTRMILFSGIILTADGVADIVFLIMIRLGMKKSEKLCVEKEQEEIRSYKEEIAQLKSRLTRKEEHLDERKDKVIRNATEEAQRILREAKETADQTIRQINKLAADSGINKELEAQRTKLREQLKKTDDKLAVKAKGPSQPVSAKKLKIGDGVKVLSMNLKGTVSSLPDSTGNLFVQMGILRSKVNIRDIELIREDDISATLGDGSSRSYGAVSGVGISKSKKTFSQAKGSNSGSGQIKMSKSFSVSPEVNLIGMTTDEAVPTMEKYLDDAYLAHLPSVRVVHGRGTGALKTACHKRLKQLKYVKDFRLGEFGEGGTGVTIVTFK